MYMNPIFSHKVYKIDDAIPSVGKVLPMQRFTLKLQNAFGQSFTNIADFENYFREGNQEQRKNLNHPCTGPIEIETSSADISLAVTIIDIKVEQSYQCLSRSTGFLKHKFSERACSLYSMKDRQHLLFKGEDLLW